MHNSPSLTIPADADAPLDDQLAELREDQRQRWLTGNRVPAEKYLEDQPELALQPEAALELIYGEYLLREGLNEAPDAEEFVVRFPQLADRLRKQFAFHHALDHATVGPQGNQTELGDTIHHERESTAEFEIPAEMCPRVPGYRMMRELGRGGMGVVYLACQESAHRLVALKML